MKKLPNEFEGFGELYDKVGAVFFSVSTFGTDCSKYNEKCQMLEKLQSVLQQAKKKLPELKSKEERAHDDFLSYKDDSRISRNRYFAEWDYAQRQRKECERRIREISEEIARLTDEIKQIEEKLNETREQILSKGDAMVEVFESIKAKESENSQSSNDGGAMGK